MSIKEIVDFKLNEAMVGVAINALFPNDRERLTKECTQQIISEIVGELEQIPIFLTEVTLNDGKTKKWEHSLFKSEVIETIKKMGEV